MKWVFKGIPRHLSHGLLIYFYKYKNQTVIVLKLVHFDTPQIPKQGEVSGLALL